jgi:hypothetical protein
MTESLEVVTDVVAKVTQEGVKFEIEDGALGALSQSMSRYTPNFVSQLGCPICSAAICAAVKAVKAHMTLEEAVHEPRRHIVSLTFTRGATSETS